MQQLELNVPMRSAARTRGEEAADACATKAERVSDFDREGAMKFVHGYLVRHGQQPGEALVNAAKAHGYRPHDDRAFGSVFATLVKRGLIRHMGYCERVKGHGTAGGRIWGAAR